jgi:hypothetical protein
MFGMTGIPKLPGGTGMGMGMMGGSPLAHQLVQRKLRLNPGSMGLPHVPGVGVMPAMRLDRPLESAARRAPFLKREVEGFR